jgi:hypothetical protein
MRPRQRATVSELRQAINCLPRDTRLAMLEGIGSHEIIAGAYTHAGGICPMLAAHRHGGRTSVISFARAWDRMAFRDGRTRRARRATERELLILRAHLQASLLADEGPAPDLADAIRAHEDLRARQSGSTPSRSAPRPSRPRPGDQDRSRELGARPGWGWMRVVRRLDDYERALASLEQAEAEREPDLAGV